MSNSSDELLKKLNRLNVPNSATQSLVAQLDKLPTFPQLDKLHELSNRLSVPAVPQLAAQLDKFEQLPQLDKLFATVDRLAIPASSELAARLDKIWALPQLGKLHELSDRFAIPAVQLLTPQLKALIKSFQLPTANIQAMWDRFVDLPERVQNALIEMAKRSYFVDPDEMSIDDIIRLGEDIDSFSARKELMDHFGRRAHDIGIWLQNTFPSRAEPIQQAFQAHSKNQFYLSIPVLLSQADGLFIDLGREDGVYKTRRISGGTKVPRTVDFVEAHQNTDGEMAMLLGPLTIITPLLEAYDKSQSSFDHLNRNAVLHGHDLTYGTNEYSLQAISWINYVGHIVSDAQAIAASSAVNSPQPASSS